MEWYNMSTDGTFSMDLMAKRASIRWEQSKNTNPDFYYGPVTGLIARNAGYLFPARLFRNHTKENPEGVLSKLPRGAVMFQGGSCANLCPERSSQGDRAQLLWYLRRGRKPHLPRGVGADPEELVQDPCGLWLGAIEPGHGGLGGEIPGAWKVGGPRRRPQYTA